VRLDQHTVGNGVVGFLFATTGPMAILLAAAARGRLSDAELFSWVAASYGIGAIITFGFSVAWRQPLVLAWSIPGAVIAGAALERLPFEEVIGAYIVTGVVMAVLGVSGLAQRLMAYVPAPVIMAMVAAMFFPIGVGLVHAFSDRFVIAAAMVLAYVLASIVPAVGRYAPPVVAALIAGALAIALEPGAALQRPLTWSIALPNVYAPSFTVRAIAELVLPLTASVIGIQNSQGIAYLRSAGYHPPERAITTACGLGSIVSGLLGAVPVCLTGPVTGIINLSGATAHRWVSAVVFAVLAFLFALFAATVSSLGLALPGAFIAALGGLAMLGVLQQAFTQGFQGRHTLGATVTFIVTASQLTIFNVSAAFWGLVLGSLVSAVLERADYRAGLATR